MHREQVIEWAREAGGGLSCIAEPLEHPWKFSESELIRFAALVAKHEREACAQVCFNAGLACEVRQGADLCFELSEAVRARGEK